MKPIVVYHEPSMQPLPGSITAADVSGAILPAKIESARRLIAQCVNLEELLRYQDQAQGIAAAVKVMKHVAPEIAAQANRMCKEAIVRLGELLLSYSGRRNKGMPRHEKRRSDRMRAAADHGLSDGVVRAATRIASAPKEAIERVLNNDSIPASMDKMSKKVPPRTRAHNTHSSDHIRAIMRGFTNDDGSQRGQGLVNAFYILKKIEREHFSYLTTDERLRVKEKLVEIQEVVDELEQLLRLDAVEGAP